MCINRADSSAFSDFLKIQVSRQTAHGAIARERARASEGVRERARRGREFCLQGTVRDEDQVSANIRGGALGAMMFVPVAPVTVAAKGNGLGVEHRTNALQDADDVYHQRSMAPGTHVAKGNNLGLVLQPCCYLHRPSTALRKPCLFPPETAADPNTRERERERELLFKRETEHLWLRQLMHGIGGGPR